MLKIKSNKIIKYEINNELKLINLLDDLKMSKYLNKSNLNFFKQCLEKLDNQEISIGEFRKQFSKLLTGKSKFQIIFWESRGYSKEEAERLSKEHSSAASQTSHNNRTPEERKELAKKANKKRVDQMKELVESDPQKLKEQLSTTVEYYLARGMNQEEAEKALKERQATFSKKKMIEKYGEKEGLKKVEQRNKKWIESLKENNEWDELSKKKRMSLEKMIEKYGEEEGTEIFNQWLNSCGGKKLEFYTEKYGEDEGREIYNNICGLKGYKSTLNYYLEEYGEKLGLEKWEERMETIRVNCGQASKESLEIFIPLLNEFKDIDKCYLGHENYNEWFIWDNDLRKQFRYDFTLRNSKIIIEYNGETFHPNKNKLTEEEWKIWESPFSKESADTVYNQDQHKLNLAKENGFKILELWSSTPKDENIEIARNFILENS